MPKSGKSGPATAVKSTTTFKVSVLRCRTTNQVLFLEAGKLDFVDTLFSFLLLPVSTIIHMLSKAGVRQVKSWGGISSIFESMEKLDCSFLHVDKKLDLMQPKPAVAGTCRSTGLLKGLEAAEIQRSPIKLPAVYYRCENCANFISDRQHARCECNFSSGICSQQQAVLPKDLERLEGEILKLLEDPVQEATCSTDRGFVRKNITYMVTDNLEIMPSTTITSIQVLNKLKVATLADLECTDAIVSITQMLQLLQSALTSDSCLNDVFGMK